MRTILASLTISAALLASPAMAQRSGTYAVEGRGMGGERYEGSAQLQATGPDTWRITWRVAGQTSAGVGFLIGNLLVIGYVSGRDTGAAAYEVMPDGRLVGRWTQGREGGIGTETLLPR
jgi:hypothetical protein